MSYVDARGAQQDFSVAASSGIFRTCAVTTDGEVRDLTDCTLTVVLKDDREQARDYGGEYGTEITIGQTITDDEGGLFNLSIPYTYFENKEGGRLSYELYLTEAGNRIGLMWGYIDVQERG